jgi:membrane-associated phospholipid phosphatase
MVPRQTTIERKILMAANKLIATQVEDHPAHKTEFTGSRVPGLLGKWPIIGLIMFIFGGLVFGGLAYNLETHGPLLEWDRSIANTLPAIALKGPAVLQSIMDAGYYIGDQVIMVLAILLGLFFIIKRSWKELAMVTFGLVGASSLFLFLSNLFARPRPPTQIWIVLTIPGFPSGHAITVVVFYGLLAYLLAPKMKTIFWKVIVVAAALLIIAFVGFSRVFTGGHYLTDVLSGYAVGIAWSGVIYTLIEIIFKKLRSHNVKKE